MIDLLSLAQSWGDDEAMGVAVSLDLVRGDQNHVHRLSSPVQIQVDIADQAASVKFPPFDHKKVQIAVWSHLAPGSRAKEDDPLRLRDLDDTPHDFVQHLLFYLSHLSNLAIVFHVNHCETSFPDIPLAWPVVVGRWAKA